VGTAESGLYAGCFVDVG